MYNPNYSVSGSSPLGEAIDDVIRKSAQQCYSSSFAAPKSSNNSNTFYFQSNACIQDTSIFSLQQQQQPIQTTISAPHSSMMSTPSYGPYCAMNHNNITTRASMNKNQNAFSYTLADSTYNQTATSLKQPLAGCADITYKLSVQRQRAAMNRDRYRKVRFCVFCQSSKQPEYIYKSHVLKDTLGRVKCPYLRNHTCPQCGASGDDAHTIKYCPATQPTLIFT